jgi:hypothetical protein
VTRTSSQTISDGQGFDRSVECLKITGDDAVAARQISRWVRTNQEVSAERSVKRLTPFRFGRGSDRDTAKTCAASLFRLNLTED